MHTSLQNMGLEHKKWATLPYNDPNLQSQNNVFVAN
jgi:hypothetical protein